MKLLELMEQLEGYRDSTKAQTKNTVVAFERFLGRPAKHSDLSEKKFAAFLQWWECQGHARLSGQNNVSLLRTLWRLAAKLGLMPGPADGRKYGEPSGSLDVLHSPPAGTLWEAFVVFASLRMIQRTQEAWRLNVLTLRWFDRFLGRHATPADLTDANIVKFEAWLNTPDDAGQRRAERTTQALMERLLAFWTFCANAAYVDHLPTVKRANRWEATADE